MRILWFGWKHDYSLRLMDAQMGAIGECWLTERVSSAGRHQKLQ